jgi:prevent-host-death family protein
MSEITVGVRDLKARLSEYLHRVKQGQTIVITDHGQPVGRILPIGQTLDEKLQALREAGLLEWSGKKLQRFDSPVINSSGKLASDLVVEMRDQDL